MTLFIDTHYLNTTTKGFIMNAINNILKLANYSLFIIITLKCIQLLQIAVENNTKGAFELFGVLLGLCTWGIIIDSITDIWSNND